MIVLYPTLILRELSETFGYYYSAAKLSDSLAAGYTKKAILKIKKFQNFIKFKTYYHFNGLAIVFYFVIRLRIFASRIS